MEFELSAIAHSENVFGQKWFCFYCEREVTPRCDGLLSPVWFCCWNPACSRFGLVAMGGKTLKKKKGSGGG